MKSPHIDDPRADVEANGILLRDRFSITRNVDKKNPLADSRLLDGGQGVLSVKEFQFCSYSLPHHHFCFLDLLHF